MLDQILSMTALPNLHPALVHFPIALLPMALLFEVLGLTLRRQDWFERAAVSLYVAAALGALVARWAGVRASDGLVDVPAEVQLHIARHSDWAHYSLWTIGGLALLRLLLYFRDPKRANIYARAGLLLVGLGAMGLIGFTADLGGGLVYQHAVAVGLTSHGHSEASTEPPRGGPSRDVDVDQNALSAGARESSRDSGTVAGLERSGNVLRWEPAPEDAEALGTILVPAHGSSLEAVSWLSPTEGALGLGLEVSGRTLLILAGTMAGDVEVEATLVFESFTGTLSVAHHLGEGGDGGFLTVTTESRTSLSDIRHGRFNSLSDDAFDLPTGPFTVAVSAAGRHLRGLVDGSTVTHAHLAPLPEGPVGLLLDGLGSLRILSIEVTLLESD